ncbi:MAG: transposase [Candidatus Thiodiazotropha sp. (ex Lucinoma kastoroae)]|nr:transposase [Candidatus Thiodiazotropha sp. (ex Lucinoma kastoroae)]
MNLLVCQMVALNRVRKLIKSMIGFVLRLYQALESWALQATEPLLKAPSIKVDETSFRVDKKSHWIHVYSSADLMRKFLHRKRGTEAIEAINIIPRYGGAIIHDGWSSYWSYHHGGQLTKR